MIYSSVLRMKAENRLNYFQLLTWARQLLRYLTAEATSRVFGNRLRLGSSENLVIHSLWILLDHGAWHLKQAQYGQAPTVQARDQNSRTDSFADYT
jgi:hypothetical protein